ncbi:MAG: sulfotransferase [Leptolyngbyaceae cyanobacterium RM1_1_2]|nr:sulfotransferase [Leptolyngbyaceae cyanobacterium RM1_1_2]
MNRPVKFIVIGAMKCATTTLHEQLVAQPNVFMPTPKEPNFFSNDDQYVKGIEHYFSLFDEAEANDLCGEASTHYTKLPTYPHTVERLKQHLPNAKLVYMMRHPVDRLVSHYIHEWTELVVSTDINTALQSHPELIAYSQYTSQLQPFFEAFGPEQILPVFFERFCAYPQLELERICEFIGYSQPPIWQSEFERGNVSSQRMRRSVWRDALVEAPLLKQIRKQLVPKELRNWVKTWWTLKEKPQISPENLAMLQEKFDQDLSVLGEWLGLSLNCSSFKATVKDVVPDWKFSRGLPQQNQFISASSIMIKVNTIKVKKTAIATKTEAVRRASLSRCSSSLFFSASRSAVLS